MNLFYLIGFIIIILIFLYVGIQLKMKQSLSKNFVDRVRKSLESSRGMDLKLRILELDKILDLCLRKHGYKGNLGEKMKKHNKSFINTNSIWSAHKMRNKLAHEVSYHPSEKESRTAISSFEKEIKKLAKL